MSKEDELKQKQLRMFSGIMPYQQELRQHGYEISGGARQRDFKIKRFKPNNAQRNALHLL